MLMQDEWILGFDVREMHYYGDVEAICRDDEYCCGVLRDGIVKPLTVKEFIWCSVFKTSFFPPSDSERLAKGYGIIPLPECTGSNHPLWENLKQMRKYLRRYERSVTRPCWVIAITGLFKKEAASWTDDDYPGYCPTIPDQADRSWKRIGFDIADRDLDCSLTDCGHPHNEADALRARWGPFLNPYNLFDAPGQAMAFRDEVRPCDPGNGRKNYVYCIWLIEEIRK